MKCKECMSKGGYKLTAVGAHTVRVAKCDECNEVKIIWPLRHYKQVTIKGVDKK